MRGITLSDGSARHDADGIVDGQSLSSSRGAEDATTRPAQIDLVTVRAFVREVTGMNDTPEHPDAPPERPVISHPSRFRINMGRTGVALSLVPFAAIAFGAALGLP